MLTISNRDPNGNELHQAFSTFRGMATLSLPRDLDLVLLRAFVAVAETGQVTKASQRLHLSQSAVSQQLHRLERLIEIRLFEHLANRIKLTAEGRLFYGLAVKLILLNDEILQEMRRSREAVEIRLGVPHDLVERHVPEILRRFSGQYPKARVKLVSMSSGRLLELLDVGQIDLTLTTEAVSDDEACRLGTDQLVWVGARNARAHLKEPLIVSLGDDGDMFRAAITDVLNQAGVVWQPVTQVGSIGSVMAMLAADMAIAPFLSHAVPSILEVIPEGHLPALPIFYISLRHTTSTVTPELSALSGILRDCVALELSSNRD